MKYIPKKELKKEFMKLENNPNFTYSVKNSKLLLSSKIIVNDTIKYCFIKYGADTHIKFKDDVSIDSKERIKEHFKKLYGVNYKFSKNEITTYKEQELIGLNDSIWRFIIYKDKLKPYMSIWVPEKVLDSLLLLR